MSIEGGRYAVRLRPHATIGRPDGVLWLTPAEGVGPLLAGDRAADDARDRLGLMSYAAVSHALVALHVPGWALGAGEQGRPTFADAGGHTRFKCRADRAANRRRSAWGCTADLARLALEERSLDGLPERVAYPVPAQRLATLDVTPLGPTTQDRSPTARDHERFADRLCARHGDESALRKRILGLL
jgi:hypothetical protein